jgi:hypothetical protein
VTTLDQLKQAVIAGDCPLGIYADALEESGRPVEAEHLRAWAKVYPDLTETMGNVVIPALANIIKAVASVFANVVAVVDSTECQESD